MQNKGIVKFIAVALVLICCFYLSFSFVTRYHENKIAELEKTNPAQAREYMPEHGRFAAQDWIKGHSAVPASLNAYISTSNKTTSINSN